MARYGLTLIEVSTRSVLDRHNPFQKPTIITPCISIPTAKISTSDEVNEGDEEDEDERSFNTQE
jgi:hypothetical protein